MVTEGGQRDARRAEKETLLKTEKQTLLKLEFRTFVNYFVRLPAQVVKTGRRILVRLLGWNRWQATFFRLAERFAHPQCC